MLMVPLIPFATNAMQLPMALAALILMSMAVVWYASTD